MSVTTDREQQDRIGAGPSGCDKSVNEEADKDGAMSGRIAVTSRVAFRPAPRDPPKRGLGGLGLVAAVRALAVLSFELHNQHTPINVFQPSALLSSFVQMTAN